MKSIPINSQSYVGLVLAVLLSLLTSSSAKALNFDFSFVGDPNHSNVDGTVTGEIIGLQNNAASAPTNIIITSAPSGLDLPSLSYDLSANGWNLSGSGDTITVTNGVITGADYQASNSSAGDDFDLDFSISNGEITVTGLNGLETQSEKFVANVGGLSGATYTLISAPEPSTWALLFGGLSALVFCRLRLKRLVSK
jgi:hypothetical protein